ncbi:MAG: cold-shock protein [Gammaproteobacteria bacterium]|jgi:CspA family cold shock protein
MQSGTVKWFNNAKGYGFIVPEGGGEDVFVHYSTIDGSGFKTLKEGQQVQYEAAESPRGVQTTRVVGQPIEQKVPMNAPVFAQSPE